MILIIIGAVVAYLGTILLLIISSTKYNPETQALTIPKNGFLFRIRSYHDFLPCLITNIDSPSNAWDKAKRDAACPTSLCKLYWTLVASPIINICAINICLTLYCAEGVKWFVATCLVIPIIFVWENIEKLPKYIRNIYRNTSPSPEKKQIDNFKLKMEEFFKTRVVRKTVKKWVNDGLTVEYLQKLETGNPKVTFNRYENFDRELRWTKPSKRSYEIQNFLWDTRMALDMYNECLRYKEEFAPEYKKKYESLRKKFNTIAAIKAIAEEHTQTWGYKLLAKFRLLKETYHKKLCPVIYQE